MLTKSLTCFMLLFGMFVFLRFRYNREKGRRTTSWLAASGILAFVVGAVVFVVIAGTEKTTRGDDHTLVTFTPTLEPTPVLDSPLHSTCKASWYGPGFHGRITANGETYNQYRHTAAHRKIRFNQMLLIRNVDPNSPRIGDEAEVRVNDRGPYVKVNGKLIENRCIDLSAAAFETIADPSRGIVLVEIRILDNE